MKAESEPVTDDEFVLRLVWRDYFKDGLPLPIQPAAFQPKDSEPEGISLFREACIRSPNDALDVIAANKRDLYYIARLRVANLRALGLSVQPDPIPEVHGHVVVPELNAVAYAENRQVWREVQKQLAEVASKDIVHRPIRP